MLKPVLLASVLLCCGFTATVAQECVIDKAASYGSAEFIGDPWVHSWIRDIEWDNERRVWFDIEPIVYTLDVPGDALLFMFENGSEFLYGADQSDGVKADNLSTIANYPEVSYGPYRAVLTESGAIHLLGNDEEYSLECGTPRWNLAH